MPLAFLNVSSGYVSSNELHQAAFLEEVFLETACDMSLRRNRAGQTRRPARLRVLLSRKAVYTRVDLSSHDAGKVSVQRLRVQGRCGMRKLLGDASGWSCRITLSSCVKKV